MDIRCEQPQPQNNNDAKMYEMTQINILTRDIRELRFENERLLAVRTHAHALELKNQEQLDQMTDLHNQIA